MPRTLHSRQRRYRMAIAAADLAFGDLGAERLHSATCSNQLSDVVSFRAAHVVELEHANILGATIDATALHRFEENPSQDGYSMLARASDVRFMTRFVVSIVLLLTLATITMKSVTVFG